MRKKRILVYGLTSLIGGVETYIINLLKNIDKNKFEIDLLVQDDIVGINKEKIDGEYSNIIFVENFKRHPIKAMKTLKKIYKENNYDVVHLNLATASSSMYALPCKIYSKNTKILIHSHNGSVQNRFQHYVFRFIIKKIADVYIACSDIAAKWMFGEKIVDSGKVIFTNNAIQTERFVYNNETRDKIRKEYNFADDFVIGHVGRFNEEKNHVGMINMLKDFLTKRDDVKLVLIGNGVLENKAKELVKKYRIDNKVFFLGVKSNINEFYQAFDLFILPSLFEGMPIVGIEAQAAGLKCIFSDTITKEADITGNVSFISIDENEKWIDEIIKIRDSKYDRKNMSKVLEEKGYDLKKEIKKIEKIYEN